MMPRLPQPDTIPSDSAVPMGSSLARCPDRSVFQTAIWPAKYGLALELGVCPKKTLGMANSALSAFSSIVSMAAQEQKEV